MPDVTRLLAPIRPRSSTGSGLTGLRASIVAAVLAPAFIFGLVAWTDHENTLQSARARVDRTVQVAEEHAARTVQMHDLIADLVLTDAGQDDDRALRAREPALHESFAALAGRAPHVQSIWMWGADARALATNRTLPAPRAIDVSDREYFRVLKDGPNRLYVSERLTSRLTGEPFVDIARRRELRDGRFAGVVSVSLNPAYVQAFYETLADQEPGLAITLLRSDGAILARWPWRAEPARLPAGSVVLAALERGERAAAFEVLSVLDGQTRMIAMRALRDYPLVVAAGLDRRSALMPWWRRTLLLGLFSLAGSAALVTIGVVALRRTRNALQTAAALEHEAAERAKAEPALRSAQKLEALGQLTGAVAHDFNNLLSVVANNAYVRARLDPGFEQSAQAQAILRAVRNGERLTRQLLVFSRQRAGQSETIGLQSYLPGLRGLLETTVGSRVAVAIRVEPATATIAVDPSELELAILNLALNARHAMPGGGRLELEAGMQDEDGRSQVFIALSDTGHGIPAEDLPRVFEPFFSTKPIGEGTGLGLSQVREFCRRSGGDVVASSRPGSGASFSMRFPPGGPAVGEAREPQPSWAALSGHIGYVEDNMDLAAATRALLEASGCRVTHHALASDLLGAIETADRYDVVVTDVSMPSGADGVTLAMALRRRWPSLPVILMSGYSDRVSAATDAGFTVLQKPVSPDQMLSALRLATEEARVRARVAQGEGASSAS